MQYGKGAGGGTWWGVSGAYPCWTREEQWVGGSSSCLGRRSFFLWVSFSLSLLVLLVVVLEEVAEVGGSCPLLFFSLWGFGSSRLESLRFFLSVSKTTVQLDNYIDNYTDNYTCHHRYSHKHTPSKRPKCCKLRINKIVPTYVPENHKSRYNRSLRKRADDVIASQKYVTNLSSRKLTETETKVLSKGLTFVPSNKMHTPNLLDAFALFKVQRPSHTQITPIQEKEHLEPTQSLQRDRRLPATRGRVH